MAHLILKELTKSFGEKRVLEKIDLEIADGEFCVILGPSGCGKSTILRLIAGLDHQDSGDILIGEQNVSGLTPRERDIAMVFQSYALYPHMNVFENMAFSLRMKRRSKKEIEEKVRSAARLLDIDDLLGRKPRELSGGQRQRVAIGRAIVRDPRLFLFDEPLSNLDAKLRSAMRLEIAGIHQKLKNTIVYVTHDQIEAMTLAQKIVLIDQGRIQQIGTPVDVYERPANIFVATFIGSPQMNLVKGIVQDSKNGRTFVSGEISLEAGRYEALEAFVEKEIVLGIRPESLALGGGNIKGVVEFIEHIGSEKIIHVRIGGTGMTARVPSHTALAVGEDITLSVKEGEVHFFFEGRRIGP